MATALHFKRNESDAIKVAQLMLQENEPKMRLEVCWILSGIMFTNEEAMKIIFERLLKDSDEEVFEGAYRYVHEDFSDAENVPLSNLLTVAQYLVEAETRQIALQSPR